MSILVKIIPFYGVIEAGFETACRIGEEKVRASEERKTLQTKAEIEIYLKTEYEKRISQLKQEEADKAHRREIERMQNEAETEIYRKTESEKKLSEIREQEADRSHKREIEKMEKQSELDDLPGKRLFERQILFEKHRVDLFERVKRLEFNIKKEISVYDIEEQKKLTQWHDNFMRKLEEESMNSLTEKLPQILLTAKQFKDEPDIYSNFKERAFQIVDKITASIEADQLLFREALKKLNERHDRMAEIMTEMSRKFEIGYFDKKLLENRSN